MKETVVKKVDYLKLLVFLFTRPFYCVLKFA